MQDTTLQPASDTTAVCEEANAPSSQPTERRSLLDDDGCAWVPESLLGALLTKAAKLNRRAAKLGCPPIEVKSVDERFVPVKDPHTDLVTHHRRDVRVQISGAAPQVVGWTFIARVQHGQGGNIVSRAPDARAVALDEELWIADPLCEHCKTRRRRKDTFILREEATGALRQIGRNCLADFLRTADVEMALAFWKYLHEIEKSIGGDGDPDEPGGWGGDRGTRYKALQDVLLCAARAIRVDGWTSRAAAKAYEDASGGQARKDATSDTAAFILDPPWPRPNSWNAVQEEREIREKLAKYETVEADRKVATDTLEWIRRRLDPTSDYERNLKSALTPDYVDGRNFGLVVSAVQAWLRFSGAYEATKREERPDAGYMGEVGKRLRKIPCEVTLTKTWTNEETGFVTNLLVFIDAEGHELKWFASGDRGWEVGDKALVTGTVKKHEEWKGRKGTILSRCILEEVK